MICFSISCTSLNSNEESFKLLDLLKHDESDLSIAKKMIHRKRKIEAKSPKDDFNYKNDSVITLSFHQDHIENIIKTKKFLNRFQMTQHKMNNVYLQKRMDLEDEMIQLKLNFEIYKEYKNRINNIRPKYAFILNNNTYHYPKSRISFEYGNVFAVFKENIKERSTFTIGDSAEFNLGKYAKTFSYNGKINHFYNTDNNYWEAQIWGPLELEDVSYFLVNCPFTPKTNRANILKLIKSNIQVYTCDFDENTYEIKKKSLVSQENLNAFPIKQDSINPEIKNIQISYNLETKKLKVSFRCSDNDKLYSCRATLFQNEKKLFQVEKIDSYKKTEFLNFDFLIPPTPLEVIFFTKDFIGNSFSITKHLNIGTLPNESFPK